MSTFLLDNDIPYRIAHALTALGKDVRCMRDEFGASAKDVDWIPQAVAKKMIVVTADRRMLRGKAEKLALKRHKITVLFLQPFFSNRSVWDKSVWLIRQWQEIEGFGSAASAGTFAKIQQNGKCTPISIT